MKIIKNMSFLAIGFVMSRFCLPKDETIYVDLCQVFDERQVTCFFG